MLRTITILVTTVSVFSACAGDGSEPVERDAARAPAASELDGAVDPGQDWPAWVEAENARIQAADPAFYDQVLHLAPTRTRNGFLRLTDPVLHDPDAAPILLARLSSPGQDGMVRAALAEALPRTGGDYSAAAAAMIETETDDVVRSVLVGTMRRATPEHALAGLRAGLEDAAPDVRAEAARTAARRSDGAALGPELIAALGDDDLGTRTEAANALGALRVAQAVPALTLGLRDGEGAVRLACLRGLARIDADAVRALPELESLAADPDPKVARVAAELSGAG